MPPASSPPLMTELEARLASPEAPALRDACQAQLDALAGAVRAHLRTGLSPAEYQACAALADAVEQAKTVLATYTFEQPDHASATLPAPFPSGTARPHPHLP